MKLLITWTMDQIGSKLISELEKRCEERNNASKSIRRIRVGA